MKREYHLKPHVREAVTSIKYEIDENPLKKRDLLGLANNAGIGRNALQWGFKFLVGMTIKQYTTQKKLEKAKEMLEEGRLTRKQIAYKCGYKDPSNFSAAYKKQFGMAPKEVREYA